MYKIYLSILILFTSLFKVQAGMIEVCPDCKINSIQEAVKIAGEGQTIIIREGIYFENDIIVDKKLTIKGQGEAIIDANEKGEIFIIRADHVKIENLTMKNIQVSYVRDLAAIKVDRVNYAVIKNNTILNSFFAIYLSNSKGSIVEGNTIKGKAEREISSANAIHLWYCDSSTVNNNYVFGHRDGIYVEFSHHSFVKGNYVTDCVRYGLHFMFSSNSQYINNTFKNSGAGAAVMYSKNIDMFDNLFESNWGASNYGILLKEITDSYIKRNVFRSNTIGIFLDGSQRLIIENNNFIRNGRAVTVLGNSEDNVISFNNFINNTFEVSTNVSVSRNTLDNNYWSSYSGYDLDKDGIGDIVHRPVTLFSYIIERNPPAIILLRSMLVDILNIAEKVTPVITPVGLADEAPLMNRVKW